MSVLCLLSRCVPCLRPCCSVCCRRRPCRSSPGPRHRRLYQFSPEVETCAQSDAALSSPENVRPFAFGRLPIHNANPVTGNGEAGNSCPVRLPRSVAGNGEISCIARLVSAASVTPGTNPGPLLIQASPEPWCPRQRKQFLRRRNRKQVSFARLASIRTSKLPLAVAPSRMARRVSNLIVLNFDQP